MTTKDLIIQALDDVPESALPEILEFVRDRKAQHSQSSIRKEIWEAYEASLQEREEVTVALQTPIFLTLPHETQHQRLKI